MRPRPPARPRATRPLVVAHRGASHLAAEHTLDAYVSAIDTGADALECDVRLTQDGHLVCVHDRRVDRTSTGRGLVSEMSLDGLSSLDFASWHSAAGPLSSWPSSADELVADDVYLAGVAPDRANGGILTLDMLLGLVRDSSRPLKLLIETKHPTRYAGLVEKTLVDSLARFGWAGAPGPDDRSRRRAEIEDHRVVVMSFAPTALRRVHLLAPDLPTVLLLDRLSLKRRDGSLPGRIPIAGPGLHVIRQDPGYVARAHAEGNRVFAWTVDEPADIDFVVGLGVDAVISNRPADVLARLG